MKHKIILAGAAALVAIIAVTGVAFMSYAASEDETINCEPRQYKMFNFKNLTDKEKTALEAEREVRRAEFKAKQEAINAALEAGDYSSWVEAVGDNCPILDKVNADNFNRYVEAHKLQEQARGIMGELGIERGFGGEFGHKGLRGAGSGMGLMDGTGPINN